MESTRCEFERRRRIHGENQKNQKNRKELEESEEIRTEKREIRKGKIEKVRDRIITTIDKNTKNRD